MKQPPWYRWAERKLRPAQGLTKALLACIALVSVVMIFVPSNTLRTSWLVYLLMP